MVSISDLGDFIGSGSQGSVWQHASEPDKVIKVMKGFPVMKDGEMDAFQYDRYLQRRFGSGYDANEQAAWMFAPMANKMVLYLFRETMAMRKDNLALPSGQVKVYAIEDQIFELKDMRRLYNIIVKDGNFGEASREAQDFKRDWLTILSPGHRHGYLMVQEKLERIGGRSRAEGQERPKVFEEWSTFLWDDFGLVTRDTKNPGNYGFRANKELVIYDPVVAPLPEQNDWSSRNVFNRLRYAYFVYLFTDIPKINDIDEYDAHEVNKIIRRFERQIIAGNFYRIEREAEGFPGSYQPEPSLNDYGLRDIMYSGTASDNFQQTLANFGSENGGWEDDVEWTQDNKKKTPVPKWQEEVEWNAPAPKQTKVRFPRAKADKIVATVEAHIKPYVEKMMACGSYRRGAQTIGDIDFVVILKDGYTLPQILPPNQGINWVGEQKAQVIIDGEKVDFRVTTPEAWGATILYFTGPADFNIKYRWMAKKRGLKLSEYGLFNRETDEYIAGATEEDIFTALGRPYRDPADRKGFQRSSKKKAEGFSKEQFFELYNKLKGRDPTLKSVDFGDEDTGYMSSINRFDVSQTYNAPYQPNQTLVDYSPQDLVTSSAVTGDFTTDSLKYGFGPTALSAEEAEEKPEVPRYVYHATPELYWERIKEQGGMIPQIGYMTYRAFLPRYKNAHIGQDLSPEHYKQWLVKELGGLKIWATGLSKVALYASEIEPMSFLRDNVILKIDTEGLDFEYYNYDEFFTQKPIPLSAIEVEYMVDGERSDEEYPDYLLPDLDPSLESMLEDEPELLETHPEWFRDELYERFVAAAEEFDAEDNYEATYGKEQAKIRRRLKNKIKKQAIMGTKAGQWSARKSQELKRQYEAACEKRGLRPYKGKKTQKQKDLSNWSKQGWRTGSGKKSSTTGEAYFPAKAVAALKEKGLYAKATRQKRAATKAGKQRATYSKDIQQVVADYRAEHQWSPQNPKNPNWSDGYRSGSHLPTPKIVNNMEELLNLYSDSKNPDRWSGWYQGPVYINFPLTVYRGVDTEAENQKWTWMRWLGDKHMGTSRNMGQYNTQPTTLNIQEALTYAGLDYVEGIDKGHQFSPALGAKSFELYAIDIQDYIVTLPRSSISYRHRHCDAQYECLDCNRIVDYQTYGQDFDFCPTKVANFLAFQPFIQGGLTNAEIVERDYNNDLSKALSKMLPYGTKGRLRCFRDDERIRITCDNEQHLRTDNTPVIFILGGARNEDMYPLWDNSIAMAQWEAESQLPICPICEGYIPNDERPGAYPGAISRYDNKTEVCSACGTAEGVGMMILGDEIYVLRDEAAEFTDDPWEIWCYIIANAKEQLPPVFFGRVP